jgi:pimeloyl-ACP methyl ester carboxylesterase
MEQPKRVLGAAVSVGLVALRAREGVAFGSVVGVLVTCLREGTVTLPDGRRLGYGEYGKRGGKPVLLFHGSPGGRQFDQGQAVTDAGAWLFVVERPGFGLSDSKPGRAVLDWPSDVAAFADAFELERFSVVGFSAGAPYALACGYAMPDRVAVVGLVCGFLSFAEDPSLDHLVSASVGDRITRYRSEAEKVRLEQQQENDEEAERWVADPDGFFRDRFGDLADSLPPYWLSVMASTFGSGPDIDDHILRYQPVGFPVEDISVPVHAWYGDQDPLLHAAEELRRRRPATTLTVYPGEGHFINTVHRPDWHATLTDW